MSYPPTSAQRSSADMYSSVPTSEHPRPPFFADDHYPQRGPGRSVSQATFDSNGDNPYDRYDTNRSVGDFSAADDHRGRSASGFGYNDKEVDSPNGTTTNLAGMAALNSDHQGHRMQRGGKKTGFWANLSHRAKKLILIGGIIALLLIAAAVAIPAAIVTKNNSNNKSESAQAAGGSSSRSRTGSASSSAAASRPSNVNWRTASWGGDGSTVYAEDGSSFQYNNSFGGFWNAVPFNDSAQAQSDTPALSQEWNYDSDLIAGVNLGGWLTIEPFITPALFEPFNPTAINRNATVIDEWTLSVALGSNLSAVVTEHYETFITEQDFAQIAAAGLNWVRLPVPYWIVESWDGEPFLANVGWTYFLKAVQWARKYGIRINLDLHTIPGSQNGYNHSSKQGSINFMAGVMGIANAQRTLDIIRTLTEFINQPEYSNVIPMFSVLNEPAGPSIGFETLRHFYYEAYQTVRSVGGIGKGKGPMIAFHDAFTEKPATNIDVGGWNDWMNGMDRVALDTHPYLCFSAPNNFSLGYSSTLPCQYWANNQNVTTNTFGFAMSGEWSLAINDCGKWLNNVGNGQRYEGTYFIPGTQVPAFDAVGSCDPWNDWQNYSQETKDGLKLVATASMSAFRSWFFWSWKIGFSPQEGRIVNPFWSYSLGLQQGWIPENPRSVVNSCPEICAAQGFPLDITPAGQLPSWAVGGTGANTILNSTQSSIYAQWPPASIGIPGAMTPVANLPTYTQTAPIVTMPSPPRPTSFPAGIQSVSVNVGDGWFQSSDTASFYTQIDGCSYPNPWSGAGAPIPTAPCSGAAAKMRRAPAPTAAPVSRRA